MVPLLVIQLLQLTGGTWASLGGFSAAIADRGGTYRTRAVTMGSFTVGGALAVVVGGLVGSQTWLSVVLTFVIVGVLSLAREFGVSAGGVATSIAVALAISVAAPSPSVHSAALRGAYLLAGGAWAMLLALVLWPIRPYRPLRLAAARCYRALADYADSIAVLKGALPNDGQREVLQQHKRTIREAIETARSVIAVSRRGAQGEIRRGERLLLIVQGADLLFGTLIAISELIEETPASDAAVVAEATRQSLSRFAAGARKIASTIEIEPHAPAALEAAERVGSLSVGAAGMHAARLLDQLGEYTMVVAANADSLESGRAPTIPPALAVLTIVDDTPPVMETIRASLTLDSLAMRHALRVAIVTAIAVLVTRLLHLPRGYWVTVTVLIILQPYSGATVLKALQRVLGTVVGALLTVGLVALVHDTRGLLVAIFVLAMVCVAFLRVNYLIYSVFLTPTFVLLAEMSAGDWHLAGVRELDTLIGGALGLLGAWLLWPTPERDRFPELAAQALRAAAAHVALVASMWNRTDDEASVVLASARRDASLAATNAEVSFERMVVESARRRRDLEAGTTLLTFTRRLISANIALGTMRHVPKASEIGAEVRGFADSLTSALECVADAVAARQPPIACSHPAVPETSHAELARPQFHRVLRQFAIIYAAAERLGAA